MAAGKTSGGFAGSSPEAASGSVVREIQRALDRVNRRTNGERFRIMGRNQMRAVPIGCSQKAADKAGHCQGRHSGNTLVKGPGGFPRCTQSQEARHAVVARTHVLDTWVGKRNRPGPGGIGLKKRFGTAIGGLLVRRPLLGKGFQLLQKPLFRIDFLVNRFFPFSLPYRYQMEGKEVYRFLCAKRAARSCGSSLAIRRSVPSYVRPGASKRSFATGRSIC